MLLIYTDSKWYAVKCKRIIVDLFSSEIFHKSVLYHVLVFRREERDFGWHMDEPHPDEGRLLPSDVFTQTKGIVRCFTRAWERSCVGNERKCESVSAVYCKDLKVIPYSDVSMNGPTRRTRGYGVTVG